VPDMHLFREREGASSDGAVSKAEVVARMEEKTHCLKEYGI